MTEKAKSKQLGFGGLLAESSTDAYVRAMRIGYEESVKISGQESTCAIQSGLAAHLLPPGIAQICPRGAPIFESSN
ncbi:hypothetical protein ACHAWO_012139 [Cyclotella atomus]|uniref:Uncharacterized protein n=1 Tax=Cyclotella atomus TaxID=382360 RepID=A0ABD3NX87_9STRA